MEQNNNNMQQNNNNVKPTNDIENVYAKALFYMGVAVIGLGLIGAMFIADEMYGGFGIFLIAFVPCVMLGLIILGLSEIINILHDTRKHIKAMRFSNDSEPSAKEDLIEDISSQLPQL